IGHLLQILSGGTLSTFSTRRLRERGACRRQTLREPLNATCFPTQSDTPPLCGGGSGTQWLDFALNH
ncbi:hypothetical protein WDZ92_44285, partial [Nostoc sp. NIES-2111]